jgi:antitoxin ParD1/3/4
MNVRLTTQQEALVSRLVAEGHYLTASEVIRDGLRLLEQELAWKADVRRKIAEGLEDVKAGRVVDGEKAIEEIRRRIGKKGGKDQARTEARPSSCPRTRASTCSS